MNQSYVDIVETEIREKKKDKAIWVKAMALSNGDEKIANTKYLTLRLQQLEEAANHTDISEDTYRTKIPDGYISISQYSREYTLTYEEIINRIHLKQLEGIDIFGEWYINKEQKIQEAEEPTVNIQSKIKEPERRESNYFLKHFNGQLPLWQSFWINTVILNLLAAYLVIVLSPQIKLTLHYSLAFVFVAVWVILILLGPWQFIGLWRSAQNNIKETGKNFIAISTLVLTLLVSINYANTTLTVLLPQIQEFAKIGFGKDDIPQYHISILRDGKELEIYGGIRFGLTKEVQKYFNDYPNIKVLHLNSLGGRVSEAKKLSEFLTKKKLITYTSTGCYSACVNIYMAGDIRLINKNAYLGFHQSSFPGMSKQETLASINDSKEFYLSRGVDKSFLDKAYTIKSSDMWKPSHYELIEAGLVTEVTSGADMSTTELSQWHNIIKLESDFLKHKIYQTIKTHHPSTFEKLIKTAHTSIKNGDSKNEMFAKTRKVISTLYLKVLPYASDTSLLAAIQHMIVVQKKLQSKSILDCYSMMMQDGRVFDLNKYYTKEMYSNEFDVMSNIISSEDRTKPLPTEKSVEKDLTSVYLKLYAKYGNEVDILDQLGKKNINKEVACKITIKMYEEILKLPKSKSVKLLRYMFGTD